MSDANKAVVRRWFDEGLNEKRLEAINELFAEAYVWHGPGEVLVNGQTGLRELAQSYLTAFPDLRLTIEHQVVEGEYVVTRVTARGTHNGPFGEIAPTGKTVAVTSIQISRLEAGKIVEDWQQFDELGMMRQIGAVPPA